ncbi:unnamed protein product, partial [Brassica oleracea]
ESTCYWFGTVVLERHVREQYIFLTKRLMQGRTLIVGTSSSGLTSKRWT